MKNCRLNIDQSVILAGHTDEEEPANLASVKLTTKIEDENLDATQTCSETGICQSAKLL